MQVVPVKYQNKIEGDLKQKRKTIFIFDRILCMKLFKCYSEVKVVLYKYKDKLNFTADKKINDIDKRNQQLKLDFLDVNNHIKW